MADDEVVSEETEGPPPEDRWPAEQDVFWRVVKSMLPAGSTVVAEPMPLGAISVEAWMEAPGGAISVAKLAVQPSIVDDPPQASNLGRRLAEAASL